MKLSKERVRHMAQTLIGRLEEEDLLEVSMGKKSAIEDLEMAITNELQVEDRLHAEVKTLMKAYEQEIDKGNVDYQKMFNLIKNKLIKDRGIIV